LIQDDGPKGPKPSPGKSFPRNREAFFIS